MSLPTLMVKGKLRSVHADSTEMSIFADLVPIEYIISWFRDRVGRTGIYNRLLVLKSETASGKSTVFPPELYRAMILPGADKRNIICTQPRVLTAIENANLIIKFNSPMLKLGENIGWSTKHNKTKMSRNGLLSATVGTLAQQLKVLSDDEIMDKYGYILIDETHERDLQTDMVIYRLKNLLMRQAGNVRCPFVILMSATFDPQSFIDYFGVSLDTNFIWCTGATAEITEHWDTVTGGGVSNYIQSACDVVEKIIREHPDDNPSVGDILIFMPGKVEFQLLAGLLNKLAPMLVSEYGKPSISKSNGHKDLPITSPYAFKVMQIEGESVREQSEDYQNAILRPIAKQTVMIDGKVYRPHRRVIITTNVAETGLTLENLKYVIDSGFNRETEYNPVVGSSGLFTKPAPQSRIRQRRGRAGRKYAGEFFPLYSLATYNALPALQFPSILIDCIDPIMMDIIRESTIATTGVAVTEVPSLVENPFSLVNNRALHIDGFEAPDAATYTDTPTGFNPLQIDMLNPPTPDALRSSLEKLYTLGFIGPKIEITPMGMIYARLSDWTPESARMLLASYYWRAATIDVVTIAAWLQIDQRSFIDGIATDLPWEKIFKAGINYFMNVPSGYIRAKILICDEFISGLVLFNAIRKALNNPDPLMSLEKWCTSVGLNSRTCMEFVKLRESLVEQLIRAGLQPWANHSNGFYQSTDATYIDAITRLKYCIYDGYRGNMLIYDDGMGNKQTSNTSTDKTGTREAGYYTLNGVKVVPPRLFKDNDQKPHFEWLMDFHPRVVLYNALVTKSNRKTNIYEIKSDRMSICDGYISADGLEFTI